MLILSNELASFTVDHKEIYVWPGRVIFSWTTKDRFCSQIIPLCDVLVASIETVGATNIICIFDGLVSRLIDSFLLFLLHIRFTLLQFKYDDDWSEANFALGI